MFYIFNSYHLSATIRISRKQIICCADNSKAYRKPPNISPTLVGNKIVDHSDVVGASPVGTLRPRQDGRHFPDDIFKWIFFNENVWISINISLKFVPRGPINNIPTLVQVMAWRRTGDKPLSEPMWPRLTTYICVTRPRWVNTASLQCHCPQTFRIAFYMRNIFWKP